MKFVIYIVLFLYTYLGQSIGLGIQICTNGIPSAVNVPSEFTMAGNLDLHFTVQNLVAKNWCAIGTRQTFTMTTKMQIGESGENRFDSPSENNINTTESFSELNFTSTKFSTDGSIRIGSEIFQIQEYCVSRNDINRIDITVCVPNCGMHNERSNLCIKKCCKLGSMINYFERNCSPVNESSKSDQSWIPKLFSSPYSTSEDQNLRQISPHYKISPPSCELVAGDDGTLEPGPIQLFTSFQLEKEKGVAWKVGTDGQVWWNKPNTGWTKLSTTNYCVDGILNFRHDTDQSRHSTEQVLIVCSDDAPTGALRYSALYVSVMFVAAFFLFLTALVYLLLFDMQNVHGWTILSQVVSMFFMYIFLATAHLYGLTHTSDEGGGACAVVGVLAHFFFLSTFCWLTLISFDLCYTFRSLNPSGAGKSKGLKRYALYVLFATTIPITVITTGLILQHTYGDDMESEVILPRYGVAQCYVAVSAQGAYVYSIVGTLLCANLVLGGITAVTIFKLKQATKTVIKNNSTSQSQSFWLFCKLFVVMGVTWIFEVISWADMNRNGTDEVHWYWLLFDMINILQAVAIFAIFVCKRRILNQLKTKYPTVSRIVQRISAINMFKKAKSRSDVDGDIEVQTAHTSLGNHSKESAETHN